MPPSSTATIAENDMHNANKDNNINKWLDDNLNNHDLESELYDNLTKLRNNNVAVAPCNDKTKKKKKKGVPLRQHHAHYNQGRARHDQQ